MVESPIDSEFLRVYKARERFITRYPHLLTARELRKENERLKMAMHGIDRANVVIWEASRDGKE